MQINKLISVYSVNLDDYLQYIYIHTAEPEEFLKTFVFAFDEIVL